MNDGNVGSGIDVVVVVVVASSCSSLGVNLDRFFVLLLLLMLLLLFILLFVAATIRDRTEPWWIGDAKIICNLELAALERSNSISYDATPPSYVPTANSTLTGILYINRLWLWQIWGKVNQKVATDRYKRTLVVAWCWKKFQYDWWSSIMRIFESYKLKSCFQPVPCTY